MRDKSPGSTKEKPVHDLERLRLLADIAFHMNQIKTAEALADFICQQIRAIIGKGIVGATLLDEATQLASIKGLCGVDDSKLINAGLKLTGTDPRKIEISINEISKVQMALYNSGRLELIPEGFYSIFAYKYPEFVAHAIERLFNIRFVYAMGFLHNGRNIGGVAIMTDTRDTVEANRAMIEIIVSHAADVINRIRIEQLDEDNNTRYKLMFESAPIAINISRGIKIEYGNPSCYRMFGFSILEDVKKLNPLDMFAPEYRSQIMKNAQDRAAGLPVPNSYEAECLRKDGTRFPVLMYLATAKFSDGPATVGFFLDITERKKAEQTLMLSEARLRAIYEGTSIGLALSDLNGKLIEINPAIQRMFGYNTGELLGKSSVGFTHPDDAGAESALFQQLLNGDIKDYRIEKRYIHKNGNIVWGRSSVSLVRDNNGKPLYAIGLIEDISQQKLSEAEKQRLRERAEMSSRLASVGEMAAGIAHEINNPLTGVIGFSEMLLERGDLPEDIRHDLNIISNGSHRVADIVKRLLTFARQTKPQRVQTDINALIDNTIELRKYVLQTANIEVNTNYDPALPALVVDPGQLQQVFINLIVNAEYAMRNTGGKLTVSSEVFKQRVRIVFRDSGPGILPEIMPLIFNPFFTTKQQGEGTGLGLSVSRSIIIEHGGDLYAESQPGQGAVFTIELPLDNKTTAAQTPEAKPEVIVEQVKPAHILVVDDEPAIRGLLGKILRNLGHSVDLAASPQEALDKISAQVYRLLLLDLRLPGMNGMELYKRILAKAPEMKGRIIFITGNVRSPDILEFFEQSRVPFFTKPFDIAALKAKVQSML